MFNKLFNPNIQSVRIILYLCNVNQNNGLITNNVNYKVNHLHGYETQPTNYYTDYIHK